jgi:UDP-N-acetylmuramate--alanine ligase
MDVGGIGMSGLALILQSFGHQVSGCDKNVFDKTRELEAAGIAVAHGHSPSHVTTDVDVVVLSTGIHAAEPEVLYAREQGKTVLRRIELLADLMRLKRGISVAGTHGKTSTSAMVATVFEGCGVNPTSAVGGEVAAIGGNAKVGSGVHFIAEIDESDPLFAKVTSDIAIITNIEDDHVALSEADVRNNYHASVEDLHMAFREFACNAKRVVYCADWRGLETTLAGCLKNAVSYGIERGNYRASQLKLEGGQPSFTLTLDGAALVDVKLLVPGEHNVLNAVATLAVAHLEGLDLAAAALALAGFRGAGRRWEILGEFNQALLVDDYAHNPTKVGAAIHGALSYGKRVRVIFQPHRVIRTARDWQKYVKVLQNAHEVLLLDIYSAGEASMAGVSSARILEQMQAQGFAAVSYFKDLQAVKNHVKQTAQTGELIVSMGAGDVTKVLREVLLEVVSA